VNWTVEVQVLAERTRTFGSGGFAETLLD